MKINIDIKMVIVLIIGYILLFCSAQTRKNTQLFELGVICGFQATHEASGSHVPWAKGGTPTLGELILRANELKTNAVIIQMQKDVNVVQKPR